MSESQKEHEVCVAEIWSCVNHFFFLISDVFAVAISQVTGSGHMEVTNNGSLFSFLSQHQRDGWADINKLTAKLASSPGWCVHIKAKPDAINTHDYWRVNRLWANTDNIHSHCTQKLDVSRYQVAFGPDVLIEEHTAKGKELEWNHHCQEVSLYTWSLKSTSWAM